MRRGAGCERGWGLVIPVHCPDLHAATRGWLPPSSWMLEQLPTIHGAGCHNVNMMTICEERAGVCEGGTEGMSVFTLPRDSGQVTFTWVGCNDLQGHF